MPTKEIEKRLIGEELINYLEHNGIAQELNRTFLHPLGLKVNLNVETKELEIWKTEDPKGYLIDRINPIHKQIFQKLSSRKNSERTKAIGFGIQTTDIYRKDYLKPGTHLLIPPERLKIETIIESLTAFCYHIYSKFISKHKEKDQYLEPDQFSIHNAMPLLDRAIIDEDWVSVAAYAMIINNSDDLMKKMAAIKSKAKEYYSRKEEMEKANTKVTIK
jgi:hypothetical protein